MREKFKKKFYEFKKITVSLEYRTSCARRTPPALQQKPVPQLLQRKTAASTRFTVSPEYRTSCARRTPPALQQKPVPQLLQRKTAASTCFTVSQVFQRQGARRTPPALHKCPFRSFCIAKLQRALVLLFHRNTAPFVLAFPGLRKSQNQCFVKHFSCKLHTNWHVIF